MGALRAVIGIILLFFVAFSGYWLFATIWGGTEQRVPIFGSERTDDDREAIEQAAATATFEADDAAAQTDMDADVAVVRYTAQGFQPFIVEVRLGETVRFVNESNRALRVTSKGHPTATEQNYPGFDASVSIGRGETFELSFTQQGVWGYKNLNNGAHLGAVVVTE